jgi:hypothetical protein
MTNEVHGTVLSRTASELHAPFFTRTLHQYFLVSPDASPIAPKLDGFLHLEQHVESLGFHGFGNLIAKAGGARSGSWRVFEQVH